MRQQCESDIDIDSNAVSTLGNGSNVDLPFAMFSHQYESKAIKLYYSMSTISYTPWFSYQINMTLIAHSRILKHRNLSLAEATRGAMTARSIQHPGLRTSVVVRLCPNAYHSSESKSDSV